MSCFFESCDTSLLPRPESRLRRHGFLKQRNVAERWGRNDGNGRVFVTRMPPSF